MVEIAARLMGVKSLDGTGISSPMMLSGDGVGAGSAGVNGRIRLNADGIAPRLLLSDTTALNNAPLSRCVLKALRQCPSSSSFLAERLFVMSAMLPQVTAYSFGLRCFPVFRC